MEVYYDDMLVKSTRADQHAANFRVTFSILRCYNTKLNPTKCLLSYLVSHRSIEANLEKIQALIGITQPRTRKEV
ncbi:unnamed protein product [Prunus armeniaca]